MTFSKSILGTSTLSTAFLQVQINGILIGPVSLSKGRYELMSLLSCGVKVTVMVVERPADILPEGVYSKWKKSLILSSSGIILKELNENDTLVINSVWVCDTPTVKSYKIKLDFTCNLP